MTRTSRFVRLLSLTLACCAACAEEGGARPSARDREAASVDAGDSSPPGSQLDDSGRADAGASDRPDADAATPNADDAGPAGPGADSGGETPDAQRALVDTIVDETIVVGAGEIFDGSGRRFIAGSALGDGSQAEDQQPVFKLEDGAQLRHVTLGGPAADGIHTHGTVLLENIVWEDIGEDALTIKEPGTVELRGGSAREGDDKVFQINAPSVFRVSDFTATNAGKFIRQNGDTTFKVEVFIDRCDISNMDEAIFRTDSDESTVAMTNTRYSEIGDALFLGVSPENIAESNNSAY